MGTNINGFNTHLHHENLQEMRKLVDLPDHSIYHMHCECSTETTAESLKDTLCNKLIPDDLENSLREKLIANVEVMDSHTHGE